MLADVDQTGPTVLLIEDDVDIAEVAAMFLTDSGCPTAVAANGARALTLLEHYSPDVIVTDLMMPVMDGFTFLNHYRAHAGPHAPVLVTSAFDQYLKICRDRVEGVLPKPYYPEELVAYVRQLAQGQRPRPGPLQHAASNEIDRLRQVLALDFEHPDRPDLDHFASRVAAIFGTAMCFVSIVNQDRQDWIASCGLPATADGRQGTPRDQSFCTHAVAARAALVVQDSTENPLFQNNPLVRSLGIRFYAGVPLLTRHYNAVGTLCLLDPQPRTFTYFDLELLGVLAKRVLASFEHWERARETAESAVAYQYLAYLDPELQTLGRPAFMEALAVLACRAAERREPLCLLGAAARRGSLASIVNSLQQTFPRSLIGRLSRDLIGLVGVDISPEEAVPRAQEALAGAGTVSGTGVSSFPGSWMDAIQHIERELEPQLH